MVAAQHVLRKRVLNLNLQRGRTSLRPKPRPGLAVLTSAEFRSRVVVVLDQSCPTWRSMSNRDLIQTITHLDILTYHGRKFSPDSLRGFLAAINLDLRKARSSPDWIHNEGKRLEGEIVDIKLAIKAMSNRLHQKKMDLSVTKKEDIRTRISVEVTALELDIGRLTESISAVEEELKSLRLSARLGP